VEALKTGGVWSLKSLMLKADGRNGVIDLLKSSNAELEILPLEHWRIHEGVEAESQVG
jgi:hypothetical protein